MTDVLRTSIETRAGRRVAALRAGPPRAAAVSSGPVLPWRQAPGILVAHDAWGLDDEVVDLVAALARAGFVALAPDVVGGRLAGDAEEAAAVAAGIDAEDAIIVLAAAADVLAADPEVRRGPLGAVGVGTGAPLAAFVATIRPAIGAVVLAGPVPALQIEAWGRSEADLIVVAEPGDDDGDAGDDDDAAALDRAAAAGHRVERVEIRGGERRADAIVRALVERLGP